MVKDEKKFEVVDVATATEAKIKDNETDETYGLMQILCKILNDIEEIKKSVG